MNAPTVNAPRHERAHSGESATSSRRARAVAREHEVFKRRVAGCSYRSIARELGLSLGAAHKAMRRALARASPPASEVRAFIVEEVERLNCVQAAWWVKCLKGDSDAAAIVIRCIAERARLLGLREAGALMKADAGRMPAQRAAQKGSEDELYRRAIRLLEAAEVERKG